MGARLALKSLMAVCLALLTLHEVLKSSLFLAHAGGKDVDLGMWSSWLVSKQSTAAAFRKPATLVICSALAMSSCVLVQFT